MFHTNLPRQESGQYFIFQYKSCILRIDNEIYVKEKVII